MNKVVCYTCITGQYDTLKQPCVIDHDVDYICFTDNVSLAARPGVWQIKKIPDGLKHLSNVKKQRIVKICPHKYLKEYSVSVWVDGNIVIAGSISKFIQQYDLSKNFFYTRTHPCRKCIYDEAEACVKMKKANADIIKEQVAAYMEEGYPKKAGMVETNIILRKHNDPRCQMLCNLWAAELLKHSHRDQLSFNYVCWKMKFLPGIMNNDFSLSLSQTFKRTYHG